MKNKRYYNKKITKLKRYGKEKGIEFHELVSWKQHIYNPNKRKEYKLFESIKELTYYAVVNRVFDCWMIVDWLLKLKKRISK